MSSIEGTSSVIRESEIPGANLVRRGKVRDLYDLGDKYLIVATDRLSAFDVVLPDGIQDKGRILTQLSLFWFDLLGVEHHLISADVDDLPESCAPQAEQLRGRFMIVEKLEIQPDGPNTSRAGRSAIFRFPMDWSTPASFLSRSLLHRPRRTRDTMRTFRSRPWSRSLARSGRMR